jgi:hypothetical protein
MSISYCGDEIYIYIYIYIYSAIYIWYNLQTGQINQGEDLINGCYY